MEKADFLDQIASGLAKQGVSNSEIAKYTDKVSSLLDELPKEELSAILAGGIDVEGFVQELINEEKKAEMAAAAKAAAKAPQKAESDAAQKKENQPAEAKKAPVRQSAEQPKKDTAEQHKKPVQEKAAQEKTAQEKPAERPVPAKSESKEVKEQEAAPPSDTAVRQVTSGDVRRRGKKKKPVDTRDYTAFWILFWVLFPIILVVTIALFAVYLYVILALAVIIIALVLVLVALAVAGSAIALVGIIYGATQMFDPATVAIGMYEIGQGVLVGGVTIFAGIVIYNIAVRLNPFLIKEIVHLYGATGKILKRLFYKVKGAMAR